VFHRMLTTGLWTGKPEDVRKLEIGLVWTAYSRPVQQNASFCDKYVCLKLNIWFWF